MHRRRPHPFLRARRNQALRCRAYRLATALPPKPRAPRAFAAASSQPTTALPCGARRCGSRRQSCASIAASTPTPKGVMNSPSCPRAATTSSSREADSSRCSSDNGGPSKADGRSTSAMRRLVEKIDFALPRGGVIAGRVTDELGEPLAGVRMQAMRYQYLPNGQRQLTPVGGVGMPFGLATNDLGEFRLYSLMPGTYIVSAAPIGRRRHDDDPGRVSIGAERRARHHVLPRHDQRR